MGAGSGGKTASNAVTTEDQTGFSVNFSVPSGFYSQELELELTTNADNVKIYYTTDGSIPTERSKLYSKPITLKNRSDEKNVLSAKKDISAADDGIAQSKVDKANIIRAAAFNDKGEMSAVASGTYFIGLKRDLKYCLPVISIMVDQNDLFDYERGIYTLGKAHDDWLAEAPGNKYLDGWQHQANYTQRGKDWERTVYAEYIAPDGEVLFGQDMGLRIMGAASRNESQKSLRLTAREEYGKKNVKAELIPDNIRSDGTGAVDKYKSFVLRNGGNDCNFAKIRDPYLQSLVSDKDFDTQQFTPAIVFLDGEYWGMYMLTEDYNDNYIENNYGIDNNNVVIIKTGKVEEGEDADYELYSEMYRYITQNDMSDPDAYAHAGELLDLEQFSDYCAFNIYIGNEDGIFENNNWRMWRVRTPDKTSAKSDGKWRMLVYDTDFSTGIYANGESYDYDTLATALSGKSGKNVELDEPPADLLRALLDNYDFRQMFVLSLCDMRNISFEKQRAADALENMKMLCTPFIRATYERFGPMWSDFNNGVGNLSKYMNGRYDSFMGLISDNFDLGDTANITVKANDSASGTILFNGSHLDLSRDHSGEYFTCYPVTLIAESSDGKKFVRWEYSGCTVSDEASPNVTVTFDGDCEITAIFE